MLPGGQYQNFPIPNPVSGLCPHKIVSPDGNLWFQYGSGLKIGRLTTAGSYAEFQVPSGIDVHDIAAAVDGNLWVTYSDYVNAWVGRITPTGQVTEFPLPFGSIPRGIVAGPDGAIWFANGYNIGRINPGASTTPPASFFSIAPCRVVDTRNPTGPYGGPSLTAGANRTFVFGGQCGIPATALAVALNVVAVLPTDGPGFLTLFPGGTTQPLAATMNYNLGKIRANSAIIPLGSLADLAVHCGQGTGTVDMVIDVNGYFQ